MQGERLFGVLKWDYVQEHLRILNRSEAESRLLRIKVDTVPWLAFNTGKPVREVLGITATPRRLVGAHSPLDTGLMQTQARQCLLPRHDGLQGQMVIAITATWA